MNKLDRFVEKTGEFLSLIFLFIVVISFYEICMRYIFNVPTIWVHESAAFLGGSLFIFGGAYALATDKHVRVVLIYDAVPQKVRRFLNLFHHIMGLVFSGTMAWASYKMMLSALFAPWGELRLETSASAWDPAFPAYLKTIIFVTMVILSCQFILKIISELKAIIGGRHV